jgi:hypothetical protein
LKESPVPPLVLAVLCAFVAAARLGVLDRFFS